MSAEKKHVDDFAILGGKPAFEVPLHVGRPNIGDRARLLERINAILDGNRLTNRGPFVRQLEQTIADFVGAKHCVAMCNGTVALEIAIRALGLGGEVIVPSFTFVATAHALQWQEITPVFCDIDPDTHTLDPSQVERLITPRTTGIIGVHTWGRPCEVELLSRLAECHGLKFLCDAAHAFGCSLRGRMIGGRGTTEVFSFHATKFVNAFEGGAVVTDDSALADKMRLMCNFGFVGTDRVSYLGTNGKMSEVSAAMGLTSIESMEKFVAANQANYHVYHERLRAVPGLSLLRYDESERCNFQYIVCEVHPDECQLSRDQLVTLLTAENILARRYFWPGCHNMEPYRSYFPNAGLLLPHTEELAGRVLQLPTGASISALEVQRVCDIIERAMELGGELQGRIPAQPQKAQPALV